MSIETLRKRTGRPPSVPAPDVMVSVRMPTELYDACCKRARDLSASLQQEVSVSEVMRRAIRRAVFVLPK